MPRPRPPSRIDAVATPLFGMCWYGDPGSGTSILAHCGGGGSAATGVKNTITVVTSSAEPTEEVVISTGDQVGVAIAVIKNPINGKLCLFVGLGMNVNIYDLPSGKLLREVSVGDNVNAIAVNSLTSRLAVGCEDGVIRVYEMNNQNDFSLSEMKMPIKLLEGHEKAVCAVFFAPRAEDKLVSAAKDGTARVWQGQECLGVLKCSIVDPKGPPPKRQGQTLVRGCAFGDLMGDVVYTVASGRRGKAFLSRWIATKDGYQCELRTECSPCPVSAMSLSGDAGMVVLGATDGTVIIWNVEKWRAMKKFPEVHDLPVTCIAARPFPVPLLCDETSDGVQMHAISASADSQLAWLTMQRTRRSWGGGSDTNLKSILNSILKMAFIGWLLYPVANEINDKCHNDLYLISPTGSIGKTWECIRYEVLLAPSTRPGIAVPPY